MTWTRKNPSKPGWYWRGSASADLRAVYVSNGTRGKDSMRVSLYESERLELLSDVDGYFWDAPLQQPDDSTNLERDAASFLLDARDELLEFLRKSQTILARSDLSEHDIITELRRLLDGSEGLKTLAIVEHPEESKVGAGE